MSKRDPLQDVRDAIQRAADEQVREAVARIAEALKASTAELLDDIAQHPEQLLELEAPTEGRLARSDVARLFKVTPSKLRTLERQGKVSVYKPAGIVWLDPEEVADALGVPVPAQ
jgi:DNA-binding transcriptional MerR regulator